MVVAPLETERDDLGRNARALRSVRGGLWLGIVLLVLTVERAVLWRLAFHVAVFVVAAFWIAGYFWKREGWLRTAQMDVDTGRRELDWDLINRERAEIATWPAWKRFFNRIF